MLELVAFLRFFMTNQLQPTTLLKTQYLGIIIIYFLQCAVRIYGQLDRF